MNKCHRLEKLGFNGRPYIYGEFYSCIAQKCKNLTSFIVWECEAIKNYHVTYLINQCAKLNHLHIDECYYICPYVCEPDYISLVRNQVTYADSDNDDDELIKYEEEKSEQRGDDY